MLKWETIWIVKVLKKKTVDKKHILRGVYDEEIIV